MLYSYFLVLLFSVSLFAEINQQKPFSLFSLRLDTSTPITVKPDFSDPIKIQPDFSKVGEDIGIGVGQIFRKGAQSFSDAMDSESYKNDLSHGMTGLADNMGVAMRGFNDNAESTLFPEMARSFRGVMGSAINKRNAFQFGGLIALSFAISATGYYCTKFLWELISYKVLHPKPVILLPGTNYGWWDRVKRWWSNYKTPVMICDESVTDRLTTIEEKTKKIRSHNKKRANRRKQLTYDNLLLCGEPGTGKTLFAKVLADRTNMDIVITTAASLLQSGVQGVKYFNDIMRMAQRSKYGLIIFIDEADALFVDRDSLSPDSDHYKVLSHILALTGEGSNKCMLIAATNHAKVMDSAMGRRFQDRVDMPLPGMQTRVELITAYIKQELDVDLQRVFSAKKINDIAVRVEGLSHAEIADMIRSIGKMSHETAGVTKKIINNAVENALHKRHKTEEEKAMREYALNVWHNHMQKMNC